MAIEDEAWRKHADELMRFATTLCGPDDAEDVVSSAYVRAVTSPSWGQVANPRAYLFRAVANEAGNVRRSRRRRVSRERLVMASGEAIEDERDVEALALIAALTTRQRAVVWLAYWMDQGVPEIADTLDLSPRTVERELQRARRNLSKELT